MIALKIESTQPLALPAFLPFADDNGDVIGFTQNSTVGHYDHEVESI